MIVRLDERNRELYCRYAWIRTIFYLFHSKITSSLSLNTIDWRASCRFYAVSSCASMSSIKVPLIAWWGSLSHTIRSLPLFLHILCTKLEKQTNMQNSSIASWFRVPYKASFSLSSALLRLIVDWRHAPQLDHSRLLPRYDASSSDSWFPASESRSKSRIHQQMGCVLCFKCFDFVLCSPLIESSASSGRSRGVRMDSQQPRSIDMISCVHGFAPRVVIQFRPVQLRGIQGWQIECFQSDSRTALTDLLTPQASGRSFPSPALSKRFFPSTNFECICRSRINGEKSITRVLFIESSPRRKMHRCFLSDIFKIPKYSVGRTDGFCPLICRGFQI